MDTWLDQHYPEFKKNVPDYMQIALGNATTVFQEVLDEDRDLVLQDGLLRTYETFGDEKSDVDVLLKNMLNKSYEKVNKTKKAVQQSQAPPKTGKIIRVKVKRREEPDEEPSIQ